MIRRFLPKQAMRPALLAIVIALLTGAGTPLSAQDRPLVLRDPIEVRGDIVTLGDLFQHAGLAARVAVFRAPDLGTTGQVSAARVAAAAERNGLRWIVPPGVEEVTVRRPSRAVPLEEIVALLRQHIAAEIGAPHAASIEIELPRTARGMHLEPDSTEPVVVKRLQVEQRSGSFFAVVGVADARHDGPLDQTYQGRAIETVEVAVPIRDIEREDIIGADDVSLDRVARSALPRDAVAAIGELVGMAARRRLDAGRPVRLSDVERPKLVQRNSVVAIVYRAPGLLLKSTGRALADGAQGESVPVINLQSKRVITAEVSATGEVVASVNTPSPTQPSRGAAAAGPRHLVR